MNKVFLIGRMTKEADCSIVKDDLSLAKFTLAIDRKFKKDETDFIHIVAWRKTAELIGKYTSKGSKIAISGAIQVRDYEAQDGTKRYITEIIADEVEFLDSKPKDEPEKPQKLEDLKPLDEKELPF